MKGINIPFVDFPDGEKRPVFFGMLGLNKTATAAGVSLGEVIQSISSLASLGSDGLFTLEPKTLDLIFQLIHTGLEIGASLSDKDYPYRLDQTAVYVFADVDFFGEVVSKIAETMPKAKEEGEAKKKTKTRAKAIN